MYVYVYVCMYVYAGVCIFVCAYAYAYVYVCALTVCTYHVCNSVSNCVGVGACVWMNDDCM